MTPHLIFGQTLQGMFELTKARQTWHICGSGCAGPSEKSRFHQSTRTSCGSLSADAQLRRHEAGQVARMGHDCGKQGGIDLVGTVLRHAAIVKLAPQTVK